MAAYPTGLDVATFLARRDDTIFIGQCNAAVDVQVELVKGFTRGRGFEDDESLPSDLRAVVIASTARLASNPNVLRGESAESYAMASGADGTFTRAEVAVLNRYRRRAA